MGDAPYSWLAIIAGGATYVLIGWLCFRAKQRADIANFGNAVYKFEYIAILPLYLLAWPLVVPVSMLVP